MITIFITFLNITGLDGPWKITIAVGEITHVSHGWVPPIHCSFLDTRFGECILEIDICLKSGTFMDTATLVSDLRAPFAVLAAKTRLLVCQTLTTVSNNVPFSLLYNVIIIVFLLRSVQLCPWKG